MDRSILRWIVAAAAATIVLGAVAGLVRRRARPEVSSIFHDGPAPPVPLPEQRTGSRDERGRGTTYGLDVQRLRGNHELETVVEYLTYIQSRRGDDSHILFVRYDDLDALARREGERITTFLERLDQLGVVVSNN